MIGLVPGDRTVDGVCCAIVIQAVEPALRRSSEEPAVPRRRRCSIGVRRSAGVERGEVWRVDLGLPRGSAPALRRPVVIVSADAYNRSELRTVTVVVLTTTRNARRCPATSQCLPASTGGRRFGRQRHTHRDRGSPRPRSSHRCVARLADGSRRCRSRPRSCDHTSPAAVIRPTTAPPRCATGTLCRAPSRPLLSRECETLRLAVLG